MAFWESLVIVNFVVLKWMIDIRVQNTILLKVLSVEMKDKQIDLQM